MANECSLSASSIPKEMKNTELRILDHLQWEAKTVGKRKLYANSFAATLA